MTPPGQSGVRFRRGTSRPAVQPLLVLVILPVAIGALAEAAFRDAKRASLAAGV